MTCPMLFSFAVLLCHSNFVAVLDGCISLLHDNIAPPWREFSRSVGLLKPTIYYGIDLFPVHWHFYNLLDDWILSTSLRNLFGLSSQYFFHSFPSCHWTFISLALFNRCQRFFVGIADFTSTYSLTHLPLFYIYILTFYNSHLYFSIRLYSSAH